MSSRLEQAMVTLQATLATIPNTHVERNRDIPADFAEGLRHLVLLDGDDVLTMQPSLLEVDLRPTIEGKVRHNDAAALGPLLDELWTATLTACLADHTLGGIAWNVVPVSTERTVHRDAEPGPAASFKLTVSIRLNTDALDPALAA